MPRRFSRLASVRAALACCLLGALVPGCGPTSFLITPVSGRRALEEREVERDSLWASKKLALIDVEGTLSNGRGLGLLGGESENPVSLFKEKLDRAAADPAVKAVVLRINSPGGGVTASDIMYEETRRFREKSGKPVIAALQDTAASGGYYLACASDRIIATPTTVTGSIGVIMITPDLSGLMDRLGMRANVIKSGPLKDAGSPFREMQATDREVFQGIIDQMYERFLAVVQRARKGLSPEQIRALADGRVFLAPQAHEAGLVDQIGTLRDALAAAKSAAGASDAAFVVVQYARPSEYRANMFAAAPTGSAVNLINVNLPLLGPEQGPQFLYLWAPER